jgi:3-methyladenine DNA glycosylase AlkD
MNATDVGELRTILQHSGLPQKKKWWENYLKHEIEFWGTPTPDIRRIVGEWVGGIAPEPGDLRAAAWELLRGPVAEEKLAALLILQEHLIPRFAIEPDRDLAEIEAIFDEGAIWEWNTTDWMCVRVLGPLIAQHGGTAGRQVARWTDAPGLWRRRAAGVSFVNLVVEPDAFPGMTSLVMDTCAANVMDGARFSQTGVGWVLREVSLNSPDLVYDFVARHRDSMSTEAIRMATAKLSDDQRRNLGVRGRPGRR